MAFALDHIVIAVNDLARAVADYRLLGFTVYPGGVHHGGVSHNALVVFADGAYFELIAYHRPDPGNPWWTLLAEAGEGFVDFALAPDDTQAGIAAARARGLSLTEPAAGGRVRPDGVRLDWQIVRPETRDLPFWCGDVTARDLRVPLGEHRKHANRAEGIAVVRVDVADIAASAGRYRALLGDDAVTRSGEDIRIAIGASIIELVGPDHGAEQGRLQTRGEGVSSIDLHGGVAADLDIGRSHRAVLRIRA
ncbi:MULTISPECIES: VOC family protein [unclassified Rhizobium]|uniref:VOC family protein n=1 Tax=unclassified Rhizobium TaxID=2613769 RepID=UPI001AD97D0F|nr:MULTISPECIES: VOC family protein [unclassified Rhizobium]MBO9100919.1 VOC family protein [Rhizobium sp. L58/93]QXZ86510.1 VOC family protein [Rhizobium sp. K1/93]QXZ92035.1 VOC family protein [Rhizobium sp. K15/93]QYA04710.1 VOC family protein [Rhizobium sp. B21/90]